MSHKEKIINTGLLLATIVLFFGGIEFFLRITGLQSVEPKPPLIFDVQANPKLNYALKKNIQEHAYRATVTTNSMGLRSPEVDPKKPVVAIVGDSIAFGYGLENDQMIGSVLGSLLPDTNVITAAAPVYHLGIEAEIYKELVAPLNPEALVLIFHFNDLEEAGTPWLDDRHIIRPEGWIPTQEYCTTIETGILRFIPGQCWLDMHSAFYKAVRKVVAMRGSQKNLEETREASRQNAFTEEVTDEALSRYTKQMDAFVAELPENLPRLFVIWPERRLHFLARVKVQQIAETHGFAVLDLYEVFGNQAETLGWDSVHPSAKTTAEAAYIIHAALEHHGLLDLD